MVGGDGERMSEARIRYRCLLRALKQRNECVVCMAAPNTHAFVPCGHRALCEECNAAEAAEKRLGACPKCCQPFTSIMRVYD